MGRSPVSPWAVYETPRPRSFKGFLTAKLGGEIAMSPEGRCGPLPCAGHWAEPGAQAGGEGLQGALFRGAGRSCPASGREAVAKARSGRGEMASSCGHNIFLFCLEVGPTSSDSGSSWSSRPVYIPTALGPEGAEPGPQDRVPPSHGGPAPAFSELFQPLGAAEPSWDPSFLGPTPQLWGQMSDGRADELRAGGGDSPAERP